MVARQLGHKNILMVAQVYGRFVSDRAERAKWEKLAAANDAKAIEAARTNEDSTQTATNSATTPVLTLVRGGLGNAKRRANPKAHTALANNELAGARGLEPRTVALTGRQFARAQRQAVGD